MKSQTGFRRGVSLVEVIVCIAILAVLIGLVVGAVQKVRTAAVVMSSKNNLRQIGVGVHSLAADHDKAITGLTHSKMPDKHLFTETTIMWLIIPYVHGRISLPQVPTVEQSIEYMWPDVKVYQSPGDPTYDPVTRPTNLHRAQCSYVYNITAFEKTFSFPFAFPDGTSQTIAFAEHYFYSAKSTLILNFTELESFGGSNRSQVRRASFADSGWGDVLPVRDPVSGKTVPSVPGRTFQVRPTPLEADGLTPQTPFAAGLPILLFDGSVRTVSPGVDPSTFWSLVTPAGGEVIGDY